MRGLGTIINVICILAGGLGGMLFGRKIKDRMRETVIIATGISTMVMAAGGIMEKMLQLTEEGLVTTGSVMMICSLVVGGIVGEIIDIDAAITRFGEWLKKKSGSEGDASFVNAFVTASCTVCIGAMAIVGSIEDGISGDYSILLAKGLLDAIIICIMAAGMGKGCVFSAIPVGILQGSVTILAIFAGGFLGTGALEYLSYVGNVLILCVGINLAFDKKIRVANMLPAIVVAAVWGSLI